MDNVLENVCPNCGGGFEKRQSRPIDCKAGGCVEKYPVSEKIIYKPVVLDEFDPIKAHFIDVTPERR